MSLDNASKPNANDQNAKKPDSFEDLTDAKLTDKDAGQVKGGFDPQPDPPSRSTKRGGF